SPHVLFTPSIIWPQSCAVAKAKFFRHVARKAPFDSFHLHCLQLCAGSLAGTGFSTYTMKTIVMQLLPTTLLSDWHHSYLQPHTKDVMRYLRRCLEEKRLNHFFFGNEKVPEEIFLPPVFQEAEPLNLYECLMEDPFLHAEALRDWD
ncbi:IPRI protein, partial [Urocolius indicus]|nr:IPRI protein [Urocolius indicus]